MFAVCPTGSRSPQIDCLAAHQNRPSGFSRTTRLSCQSKRQTLSVCDRCVTTILALKCVKGNDWIKWNCLTVMLAKTEMWPSNFKVQHLTVVSMTSQSLAHGPLYNMSRTYSLIFWENVTCLWIKMLYASGSKRTCQQFSIGLTDELTNRQNQFQQTRQSQWDDAMLPGRIL